MGDGGPDPGASGGVRGQRSVSEHSVTAEPSTTLEELRTTERIVARTVGSVRCLQAKAADGAGWGGEEARGGFGHHWWPRLEACQWRGRSEGLLERVQERLGGGDLETPGTNDVIRSRCCKGARRNEAHSNGSRGVQRRFCFVRPPFGGWWERSNRGAWESGDVEGR